MSDEVWFFLILLSGGSLIALLLFGVTRL